MKQYRFSFDMGTNSIGWAVLDVETNNADAIDIIDCGSRIFSDSRDAKEGTSLAIARREARQIRRRFDRLIRRRKRLLRHLIAMGLFPEYNEEREALKNSNPYELRKNLLEQQQPLFELGRAILHLNKRRGFKSSRKGDKEKGGKLAEAIRHLEETIGEGKTLGQFFYERLENKHSVICRTGTFLLQGNEKTEKAKKSDYEFYISRAMVEKELSALWKKQQEFYPEILTEENYAIIEKDILHQRPLLPQEVGKCRFELGEYRCSQDIPTCELYRLYLDLAHLRILDDTGNTRSLTIAQRDSLITKHSHAKSISFKAIRDTIKLPPQDTFIHSAMKSEKQEKDCKLPGCPTSCVLHSALKKERYSSLSSKNKDTLAYLLLDGDQQDILERILTKEIQFPEQTIDELRNNEEYRTILDTFSFFSGKYYGTPPVTLADIQALPMFTREEAQKLVDSKIGSTKYANLSYKAIQKILPYLKEAQEVESSGIALNTYDKACALAGYNHSASQATYSTTETVDEHGVVTNTNEYRTTLPYYGIILARNVMGEWKGDTHGSQYAHLNNRKRFGFISNPTVHVALNQLRVVVNTLIKRYGTPNSINIELARDLPMGAKSKKEYENTIENNTITNEALREKIRNSFSAQGIKRTPTRTDMLKAKLFQEAEKTWGTAQCIYSGKGISFADAMTNPSIHIEHIINKADSNDDSFANKVLCYKRENDAKGAQTPYEAFGNDEKKWEDITALAKKLPKNKAWRFTKDARKQFEERQERNARDIGDTRYIARVAKEYLSVICDTNNIIAVTGSHTHLLAQYWDLLDILHEDTPYTSTNSKEPLQNSTTDDSEDNEDNSEDKKKSNFDKKIEKNDLIKAEEFDKETLERITETVNNNLSKKNRLNHFHHAVDACIIGLFDRRTMQYIAVRNKEVEKHFEQLKHTYEKEFSYASKEQKKAIISAMRFYRIDVFSNPEHPTYTLPQYIKDAVIAIIEEQKKKDVQVLHSVTPETIKNKITSILTGKIVSHKVDHNVGGRLHAETVYGKCLHSLRIQDFSLTTLRLIEDTPLLQHILEELVAAHGIPATPASIQVVAHTIRGATTQETEKALHALLQYKKNSTKQEIYKKFMPAFTSICKTPETQCLLRSAWQKRGNTKRAQQRVLRTIPCLHNEETFLGTVTQRISVDAMRMEDLPYIKETSLLARILQKLIGDFSVYPHEDAFRDAKELQKPTTSLKERKRRVQEILNGMNDTVFKEKFPSICKAMNIRRIMCVDNKENLIWIRSKANGNSGIEVTKGVDGRNNAYTSVYMDANGKWYGECVSAYNANQKGFVPEWIKNPDNKHIIDIYQKDAIEVDMGNGERGVFIVQKMGTHGIYIHLHSEANVSKRETELKQKGKYIHTAVSSLQKINPLFVYIDPLGNIIYKKDIPYKR